MDPSATLEALLDSIANGDADGASQAAENLATWIANGGFEPAALRDCMTVASPARSVCSNTIGAAE